MASIADHLVADAGRRTDDVVSWRRQLHARPELSFEEHATTALLTDAAASAGLTVRPCPTETGVVAILDGGRPGPTVVLRADIDALPIQERSGLPFSSSVDGVMHACGHDAHAAILLGAATTMAGCAEDLPGRYLFVWQPGEELVAGAARLVAGGLLDGLDPVATIGLHVATALPTGFVATKAGVAMAGSDGLRITVTGSGGHAALEPRQGNVVLAVARLADRLGTVVDGLVWEGTACVCSPGVISAGTAANVVPTQAELAGTLRTFAPDQRDTALARLRGLVAEVAGDFGVAIELDVPTGTGPVVNSPVVTDAVLAAATALPDTVVLRAPSPVAASDDVSVLLDAVPGCYLFLGAGPPGGGPLHHSPTFRIEEAALPTGVALLSVAAAALATG